MKGIPSKSKKWAKHGKHAGTKNLGLQVDKLKMKRSNPEMVESVKELFSRRAK